MGKTLYKAFNKDLTNRYGEQFEIGKIYRIEGKLKFGNDGRGYHMCTNPEDTLRYFDSEKSVIARVNAFGNFVSFDDDYYGYDDMYSYEAFSIDHVYERNELIEMFLNLNQPFRVERFIQSYKMNEEEIKLYRDKYVDNFRINQAISYYQEGDKDVYSRGYQKIKR